MKAEIVSPTPEGIARAAKLLREGQVVGMPTETVYGLAGAAFDEKAIARIFRTKERPTFDPLIVHVDEGTHDVDALARLGLVDPSRLDDAARACVNDLVRAFWPGPLTVVLPRADKVPDLVTSGLDTVALRQPRHPVARALIAAAGTPLAAPSANRFGRISPTSAADVVAELGDRIEIVLDGGPCEIGLESTVLSIGEGGELTVLRPGGTPADLIARTLSRPVRVADLSQIDTPEPAILAPGMLASHYAPRKPLVLLPRRVAGLTDEVVRDELHGDALPNRLGLLAAAGDPKKVAETFAALTNRTVTTRVLSAAGDPEEAARNLFASLRALDDSPAEVLFAEPFPDDDGLGHAIRDRLRRAAHH
jgi:L-threonylcarbamoyladenylate synthase